MWLLVLLFAERAAAQQTTYRIGNSLTWDSQPLAIEKLAAQRELSHREGYHINCGNSLQRIWEQPDEVCVEPVAEYGTFREALTTKRWSAVVLQPYPAGSESTLATDTARILDFIRLTRENSANAATVFYIYAGWPAQSLGPLKDVWSRDVPDEDSTPTFLAEAYFHHLLRRVRKATDAKVRLVPVGHVLAALDGRIRAGRVPGITSVVQLYRDNVHLTLDVGRYVAGITTLATLFDQMPTETERPEGTYGAADAISPSLYRVIHDTVRQVLTTRKAETGAGRPVEEASFIPASLPGAHADPHIACFDGVYYIYPTTDGIRGWRSSRFSCWSSKDLLTWKSEGVILDFKTDLAWADSKAWAPCIARKNSKYYFYFSAEQQIGVAVADHPAGPFEDPLGKPLVPRGSFACQVIDPMVFIDDDGAAYLYFGQGNCNVVRLNADMISFDHRQVKRITPEGYNEGTFVIKRNGTYYLMWSSHDTRDPRYCVNYATGPSATGPFTMARNNPILKQRGPVKGAGHHSVVRTPGKDEWTIAYHRFRIPGGNGYNREVCLSPLRFDAGGLIQAVDVSEAIPSPGRKRSGQAAAPEKDCVR